MTHPELVQVLSAIHADKASLRRRHEVGARFVRQYDRNNAYQFIIAREDVHLAWVGDALAAEGAPPPAGPPEVVVPSEESAVVHADVDAMAAFIGRWAPLVERVGHARHRAMLRLLLGETREQLRLLEQGAAGRTDLLGRRTAPSPPTGEVLGARWVG